MPAKVTTTINKIETVPNPSNAEIIGEFYHHLKSSDVSENHQNNILKVPDKKWITTWNHYLNRIRLFFRWLIVDFL